jgi:hypothetical protein
MPQLIFLLLDLISRIVPGLFGFSVLERNEHVVNREDLVLRTLPHISMDECLR